MLMRLHVAQAHPAMQMCRIGLMKIILPVIAVMLCVLAPPVHASLVAVEGDARDPKNNRLLYREAHLIRRSGDTPVERIVLYRCPNGVVFARKRVDYRSSALAPEFELVDARGYREGLRRERGQTMLWSGSDAAKSIVGSKTTLVADAGFDEFLRQRWPQLTAGQPQSLAFAVPALKRSLPFKIRSTGIRGRGDDKVHRFELRLDGLLGALTSAIAVEYDADDRRLRRFTGLTNVRDVRGDQISAQIEFPQPPQPAEAQRWQAAAEQPLAACALGR